MGASLPEGISERHRKGCPMTESGTRCRCRPAYQVRVRTGHGKRITQTFDLLGDAITWRQEQTSATPPRPDRIRRRPTIREAGDLLLDGIDSGAVLNRNGDPYKPSVRHDYRRDLTQTIYPTLGHDLVTQVTPRDVQDLIDAMTQAGLSPSTIRNRLKPLQVLYRHAIFDQVVQTSPVDAVQMPSDRGRRDMHAPATSVQPMLAAIRDEPLVHAAWALMLLGGLRIGEALALRWSDIDHTRRVLHVRRSWCNRTHQIVAPKTRGSERAAPMSEGLADALGLLADQRGPEPAHALVLHSGGSLDVPISRNVIDRHARAVWAVKGLPDLSPHAARHTWATMVVEQGMPLHDVARHMGHTNLQMVMLRYAHLQPGTMTRSAAIIDQAVATPDPGLVI